MSPVLLLAIDSNIRIDPNSPSTLFTVYATVLGFAFWAVLLFFVAHIFFFFFELNQPSRWTALARNS